MEDEHVVDGLALVAEGLRELARAVQRPAVAGEGDVQREVAVGDGARDGVLDRGADFEVLEEVAVRGLLSLHARS